MKKMTKTEISWILYDIANSIYILTIITSVGQFFFKKHIALGIEAHVSTSMWAGAVAAASLIIAFLSPILGTFADYKGYKKGFFIIFLISGLIATFMMLFVSEGQINYYLLLIILSWIGFSGANIFYDSFLVDITDDDKMDWLSTCGFAWGYIGSVVPFIFIVIMIAFKDKISFMTPLLPFKLSFIIVTIWWLLFSIPLLLNVKQRYYIEKSASPVADSFKRLYNTFKDIRKHKNIFIFIIAYFFYFDGIYTVIKMASSYAMDAGIGENFLIVVILLIQIIGFPFTLIYGKLAQKFTVKKMLFTGIFVYLIITMLAFFLPVFNSLAVKKAIFWVLTLLVASSQGGMQALSRSYYASMIPKDKSAEFFGFYNTLGKFAAIMGPALIALFSSLTGSSRYGVLSLVGLFIVGLIMLTKVKEVKN